jgi:hypothetical protein
MNFAQSCQYFLFVIPAIWSALIILAVIIICKLLVRGRRKD